MQIQGSIKGIKATMSVDLEVSQQLTIEFTDGQALAELRELMQQPILVTIEEAQTRFGKPIGASNGSAR